MRPVLTGLVLCLAVVLFFPATARATYPGFIRFSVPRSDFNQRFPAVSEARVVWDENRGTVLRPHIDIYGFDLVSRTGFPVAVGAGDWCVGALVGTQLAAIGGSGVSLLDLVTGEVTCLAPHVSGTSRPVFSGETIVWEDYGVGGWDLAACDLSTGTAFPLCSAPGNQELPAISGDTVVWCDDRDGDWEYDIWGYDLSTGTEFPIRVGNGEQISPAISGRTVVWIERERPGMWEGSSLWACDLDTMESRRLIGTRGPGEEPAISGDIVVWVRRGKNDIGIWAYDLSSDTVFPVSDAPGYQWSPAIDGNVVVWQDGPVEGPPPMRIRGAVLAPDTEPPVTTAYAAAVTAGGSGRLRFRIADPTPSCGRAVVTIQIRKRGVVVDSFEVGTRRTNRLLACAYAPPLARGRYSWRVLATDLAGNTAVTRVSAILTVK